PSQLRRLLQRKEQAIKEQQSHFDAILPELNQLKTLPTESPNVRFYDTAEGIRTIMDSFLETHKDEGPLYGMSNIDQVNAFFPEIAATQSHPRRIKVGIHSKFLYTSSSGPVLKETDKERN